MHNLKRPGKSQSMISKQEVAHYVLIEGKWIACDKTQRLSDVSGQCLLINRDIPDWHKTLFDRVGINLHENHLLDSLNGEHPPKYEDTDNYSILVVPTLMGFEPGSATFSQCTILERDNLLILVHPSDWPIESTIRERIVREKPKNPNTVPGLFSFIINAQVNALLNTRFRYTAHLEEWQDRMIGADRQSGDWSSYLALQKELNRFIDNVEMQWNTLNEWVGETDMKFSSHERVRFADALEHLQRLANHLNIVRTDSDNLLQIYFSMTQEKTNDIMRLLTILTVVLLPLNLITGIFGMNFVSIPLLGEPFGFWVAICLMITLSIVTVFILKRLKWL